MVSWQVMCAAATTTCTYTWIIFTLLSGITYCADAGRQEHVTMHDRIGGSGCK
jgi:hypothetical protein